MRRVLALAALALAAAGCTVGPDYRRPEAIVPTEYRGLGPENPAGAGSLG